MRTCPPDLALKISADVIEYCTKNIPLWNPINVNMYDLRETGISAPQELALVLQMPLPT